MAISHVGLHPRPHRTHVKLKWPSSLTFPLVLLLIVTCFYWKLVFTYQYDWIWGPDLADQILPWFEEQARQLQHSQFPLWDPHTWLGQSFLGQAQPGTAYPLNWILWLIPRHHGHIQMWALQWYYVMIHYMAALFCYWLCRDLGRSRAGSLVAGLAFALAGYVGNIDWPQMVNAAVWAPLVFMFLLRAVRGTRPWSSAALCGLCLGMAWLAGHHQVPIFLTLASAGVWIYYMLKDGRLNWHIARLAAAAMIFAPAVGALQIIPAREYGRLALRWAGAPYPLRWNDVIPYYIHQDHSLHPNGMLAILFPGIGTNSDPFFGVVAVSLALLGLVLCWKQPAVKLFAAIALGGLLYALGGNSVFQGFIYSIVPWVEKARVPAMATLLLHVGLATLAAFGVDSLGASESSSRWLRRINIGVAGFAALLGGILLAVYFGRQMAWNVDDRVFMTVLAATLMAALLYAWRTGNLTQRQAVTLLTMLLLLEIGNEAGFMLADRNDWGRRNFIEKAWGNGDLAEFLHKQPGPFRVETQTEDIVRNWGDFYNLDFVQAQAGVTVTAISLEPHTAPTKKLLGVKYALAAAPSDGDHHEVFAGASGIKVYENPDVFPRAWAVHQLVPIQAAQEVREFINDHVDELRWKALMKTPPSLRPCAVFDDKVAVTKYSPSNVAIDAIMSCDGMVVLSDNFYPGWYADVDGKPAPIYEVDVALRGVLVPQGTHAITFRYRPRSVYLGAALTLAGMLSAAVITIFSRRKAPFAEIHK